MAKMISDAQRSKIFALARELGMSTHSREKDDDLHLLIDGLVAKPSITLLISDEAYKVIAELEHRARFCTPNPAPAKQPTPKPKRTAKPGGMSEGQQKKIIALMCELRKCDAVYNKASIEQRVSGIIRRELHIDAIASDPYAWLTYKDGVKLIEVIKKYLDNARNKAQARSGVG